MDIIPRNSKHKFNSNTIKQDLELIHLTKTFKDKKQLNQVSLHTHESDIQSLNLKYKRKKKIIPRMINVSTKIQTTSLGLSQFILVIYNIILLSLFLGIIFLDWSSIWQLPKSIIFIFGVTGLLFLTSILWIFGYIRHIVRINLGDILFFLIGLFISIISFINPNQIAFWGNTNRIFDSGMFMIFIVLFYISIKLFLEDRSFNILLSFISIFITLSSLIGVVKFYIPNLVSNLSILNKLQPTYTLLTEYPKELVFLTLLSYNIIFWTLYKVNNKNIFHLFLLIVYYLSLLTHTLILIRLPNSSMYILTILTIIVHTILYISYLYKNNQLKSRLKLISNRILFLSCVAITCLFYIMFARPFQNNINFTEYPILVNPGMNLSLDIAKKSLQGDTWFGSSNIIYAWDRFSNSDFNLEIPNFSFETLYNELINLIVKNGIFILILLLLLFLWIMSSISRTLLIQKTLPIELYIFIISIIGLFLIPFTVVTKILFVLILILWGNIFNNYFKPIFILNLDINKIPASISSLFTFIILLLGTLSLLGSIKIYNIFKSQEYIVKASQVQNNLAEQVNLLSKAQSKSPYMIEYANLYVQALIKQINEQAIELSNSANSKDLAIDFEKQKNFQDNITKAQALIDDYKSKFAMDSRVIYWQLDLYSITHRYGEVDEKLYLSTISRGRELKPQSQDWDIYEAQFYNIQGQKGQELNSDKLLKAKSIFNDTIKKNPFSVEAYKNYYELLAQSEDYKAQIEILEKYVNLMLEKDRLVDQELVYLLGVAYQNNQQYTESLVVYNKLLENFPDYTNVYFKLGELYETQKETNLAIQNYNKVLELDPNAEIARLKLEQLQ